MRIALLGDSICAGYGVRPDKAWAALLAKALEYGLHNDGVNGSTAQEGLLRLPALLATRPNLLYVQFGLNDAWMELPEAEYIQTMDRILREALKDEARTVILGTNHLVYVTDEQIRAGGTAYPEKVRRFNDALRDLLNPLEPRLILADIEAWTADLAPDEQAILLQWDGVHLSEEGNAFYFQRLEPVFRGILEQPAT
ncbi:MAG: SGNH/GDSL hydrolase family protein [Desulfovibrionaceae bacterium]|nr:SGNH/GDSL hydrolase family protein [Desulfovibrionaceae bacterium]